MREHARAKTAAVWTGGVLLLVLAVLVVGVGMVAALGELAHKATWDVWSSVGQAFGVLASVLSSLALVAVVIVFRAQRRELIEQQAELALQRDELRRSADANVRMLHVRLIGLAIDDPSLASVWPSSSPEVSPERHRQYLYANLILQQARVQRTIGDYSEEEFASNLRYLFTSPIIREFWLSTEDSRRRLLVPGTAEFSFVEHLDGICREYEAVLSKLQHGT
jgi:uncharacterized membrane protein